MVLLSFISSSTRPHLLIEMKAVVIALAFLVATIAAQSQYCVDLTRDDVTCANYRTNWPTKVCSGNNSTLNSSLLCDNSESLAFWKTFCPVKNVANQSFCEGTGYGFPYMQYPVPCISLNACNTDADCNQPPAPIAEAAPTSFEYFCYDCCTFCYDESTCTQKVNNNDTYTKSSNCYPCHTEPTSTTTPSTNAPSKSAGAVVVVSGIVLAFAALLF